MKFFRRYAGYVKPYQFMVYISVICGLVYVFISGIAFWLAADFVQSLLTGGLKVPPLPDNPYHFINLSDTMKHYSALLVQGDTAMASLSRAIIFIVIAFFIKNIARYIQTIMTLIVEQRVARDMRNHVYSKLMRQDLAYFHTSRGGELVSSVINDVQQMNNGIAESFTKLLRDPITALLFLFLLFAISWKMTLAALIIAPFSSIIIGSVGASLKRKSRRTQDRIAHVTDRLNETLYGIRIVQAYGGEDKEKARFQAATQDHFKQALRRERMRRITSPMNEVVGVMVIAAILLLAGGKVLSGQWISADDFIRFLVMLFGLLNPIAGLGKVHNDLKMAEGAGNRVFELMDSDPQIKQLPGAVRKSDFNEKIELKNVTLVYGENRDKAVNNVSLKIDKGQQVVLVGRSGSGKSTILNLLPRFYDVTAGEILIDGIPIKNLDMIDLRKLFGVVSQEIILFNDTVAANIAYDEPETSREKIIEVAKAAHAHEFIMELPDGYDTQLGDLGDRLSGGQRQRISIARALLKNPPILLLDEPTSALDSDVAEEILRTLEKVGQNRTVITATHRLSSISAAERIVMLDKGEVIGEGVHDVLFAENQLYHELCEKQFAV